MKRDSLSIVLGGAAGLGIQTVETILVGLLKAAGYHVYACKEYMSRVRGGSNSTEIRVGSRPVLAYVQNIDLLFGFDKTAIEHLRPRITEETWILTEDITICGENACPERLIHLPFTEIATKIGDKIYSNIISVGLLAALFDVDETVAVDYLGEKFGKKGPAAVQKNIEAYRKGIELSKDLPKEMFPKLTKSPGIDKHLVLSGAEAVAYGAIAGGCNFHSAYPMSPHTNVMTEIAQRADDFGIIIDQAEDEISAVNKAIGAWYAGARALVSTSGGGYDLMTEGVSMAAMIESPLVIHLAQRPGPATGLPTRTAQEDLNLALYAGHGEFPRIILAPGSLEEGFYLTQQAFNLADEFQVPVFVLTDQYYVDTYYNFANLDVHRYPVKNSFIKTEKDYKRYSLTESGISPRGIPGYGEGIVRADTDEHDEWGSITEDLTETRPKMVEKRIMKRKELLLKIIIPPEFIGATSKKKLVITWGSNYHILVEALEQSGRKDLTVVHFKQLYPLAPQIGEMLQKAQKVVVVECNATGQFAQLLQGEFSFLIPTSNRWIHYNGMPFSVEELTEKLGGF